MAGRFAYLMMAGAAVVGGMFLQGDIDFNSDQDDHVAAIVERDERAIDRSVDRIVDRETDRMVVSGPDRAGASEAATKRALSEAVEELVRAEGSLITAKLDDEIPDAVIKQAEQRRNAARQAVERLADDAKAGSRGDRDALRENIRATVRDAVRG